MKTVSLGLIGLGGIGKTHFRNIMRLKNARLVGVADISEAARNFAKAKGIKRVYDDYARLLEDPAIRCVVIALPTYLHSKCALMAAEYKKHIFLEKPLARNAEEGKEIVSEVQKAGVKAMVGYPLRFSEFARFKTQIDSGYLGDVVNAYAVNISHGPFLAFSEYSVPVSVPDWWFNPKLTGGGALIDMGSHMINLMTWYFGDKIVSVKSVLGHRFNMPFEDHAMCLMKFKQGVTAIVNVGWYCLEKALKVELFGTRKTVSVNIGPAKTSSRILQMLKIKMLPESSAFYNELDYFVKCVINDCEPSPSLDEALKDLEIISLAYKNQIQPT